MGKRIDHTNKKYGRLTVLEEAEPFIRSNGRKRRGLKCLCECSNTIIVRMEDLTSGNTQSCGCLKFERIKKANTKHGHTVNKVSKEYDAWGGMKHRCYNKNYYLYHRYGGRGITVCDEWLESFEAFYNHIGPSPDPSYSIDRINNDGNYEPGNVRWASSSVQSINQSTYKTNTSGHKGVTIAKRKYKDKYRATITVNKQIINLGAFDTFEEAVQARKDAEELYHKPLL